MPSISKYHSTTVASSQPINTPITKKTIANQTKQISNQHVGLPKSILKSTGEHQNNTVKKSVSFNLPAQENMIKSANAELNKNEPIAIVNSRKVTTRDLNLLSNAISDVKNSIRELMIGKDSWHSAQKLADISHKLFDIKNKIQDFNPMIKSNPTKGQQKKLTKLETFEKRIEKRQNELAPMKEKNDYEKNRSNDYAKSRQVHVESNKKAKTAKLTEHN